MQQITTPSSPSKRNNSLPILNLKRPSQIQKSEADDKWGKLNILNTIKQNLKKFETINMIHQNKKIENLCHNRSLQRNSIMTIFTIQEENQTQQNREKNIFEKVHEINRQKEIQKRKKQEEQDKSVEITPFPKIKKDNQPPTTIQTEQSLAQELYNTGIELSNSIDYDGFRSTRYRKKSDGIYDKNQSQFQKSTFKDYYYESHLNLNRSQKKMQKRVCQTHRVLRKQSSNLSEVKTEFNVTQSDRNHSVKEVREKQIPKIKMQTETSVDNMETLETVQSLQEPQSVGNISLPFLTNKLSTIVKNNTLENKSIPLPSNFKSQQEIESKQEEDEIKVIPRQRGSEKQSSMPKFFRKMKKNKTQLDKIRLFAKEQQKHSDSSFTNNNTDSLNMSKIAADEKFQSVIKEAKYVTQLTKFKDRSIRESITPAMIQRVEFDYTNTMVPPGLRNQFGKDKLKVNDLKVVETRHRQSNVYQNMGASKQQRTSNILDEVSDDSFDDIFRQEDKKKADFQLNLYPKMKVENIILDSTSFHDDIMKNLEVQLNRCKLMPYLVDYCQISAKEMVRKLMHWFKYSLMELKEEQDKNLPEFKDLMIEENITQKILHLFVSNLERINYLQQRMVYFREHFNSAFEQYICAHTVLDEMGGKSKVLDIMEKVTAILAKELDFEIKWTYDKILILGEACSLLLSDQYEMFRGIITLIQKKYDFDITKVEFFLVKYILWGVLEKETSIHSQTKQRILQRIEGGRSLIFNSNYFIYEQIKSKILKDKARQQTLFNSFLEEKQHFVPLFNTMFAKVAVGIVEQGYFLKTLRQCLKIPLSEQFIEFLQIYIREILSKIKNLPEYYIEDIQIKFHIMKLSVRKSLDIERVTGLKINELMIQFDGDINEYIEEFKIVDKKHLDQLLNTTYFEMLLNFSYKKYMVYSLFDQEFAKINFHANKDVFEIHLHIFSKNLLRHKDLNSHQVQIIIELLKKLSFFYSKAKRTSNIFSISELI